MSPAAIRQATLALLERASGEWVTIWVIEDTVMGRPYEKDDYFGGHHEDGSRVVGPRTLIHQEVFRMRDEGLIQFGAHRGFRLAPGHGRAG